MKTESTICNNFFITICLFIPFVLTNAVIPLVRKVYAYVQSELEKFHDIYGAKTPVECHTDPAFIAYIKGEETVQGGGCPQRRAERVGRCCYDKSTTEQTNNKKVYKGKESKPKNKKRNKRRIKIDPPPVEELILRDSIAVCRTEHAEQRLTEAPQQESPEISVAKPLEKTSAAKELERKGKIQHNCLCMLNALLDVLLFVPQKIRAYVQRALENFSDAYLDSMAELACTEPAFVAYLKGEEAAPFVYSPHITFSNSSSKGLKNITANSEILKSSYQQPEKKEKVTTTQANTCYSSNISKEQNSCQTVTADETSGLSKFQVASHTSWSRSSSKRSRAVKKQLNASPPIVQQTERQVNSVHEDKENGEVTPPSHLHSNEHSTADFQVRKSKVDKKTKRTARVKAQGQEKTSQKVEHSNQVLSDDTYADSKLIASHDTKEKSSVEEQVVVESRVSRVGKTKNEEDCEQVKSRDVQAPIGREQDLSSESRDVSARASAARDVRNTKRKAEEPAATEFSVARKRQRVDTGTVILPLTELLEDNQPSVSASCNEHMQATETEEDSLSVTRCHSTSQLEEMETNHELGDTCKPVQAPVGDLEDAKRPLPSTVGMLSDSSMMMKTPSAEQAVSQPAMPLVMQYSMQPDATICNENPQGMESKLGNGWNFPSIQQQMPAASDMSKHITELSAKMKELQLESDDSCSSVNLDSDSDYDFDVPEYDLGLGEQVLLLIELLAGEELPSD